jgi:hypothetical protein
MVEVRRWRAWGGKVDTNALQWLIEMCEANGWKKVMRPALEEQRKALYNEWLKLEDATDLRAHEIRAEIKVINWFLSFSEGTYRDVMEQLERLQLQQAETLAQETAPAVW